MAAVLGLDPVRLLRADAPLPLSNAGFNGTEDSEKVTC